VGPRAGLDTVEKREIPCPCRQLNPNYSVTYYVNSLYTGSWYQCFRRNNGFDIEGIWTIVIWRNIQDRLYSYANIFKFVRTAVRRRNSRCDRLSQWCSDEDINNTEFFICGTAERCWKWASSFVVILRSVSATTATCCPLPQGRRIGCMRTQGNKPTLFRILSLNTLLLSTGLLCTRVNYFVEA
jgi:hypothetical protein